MDLIFFGMQGSGKGTLGKFIAAKYGMDIFEMGGELRKLSAEESELGKKVKSIIEAGHLVSDDVVMEIVEDFMNKLPTGKNILFDGIPRKPEQAKLLNSILDKHGRTYKAVLLDIAQETAMKRLTTRRICKNCKAVYPVFYTKPTCEKCNGELVTRSDDNPDAIKTRLDAFSKETVPSMALYTELIKIDGEPAIEEVQKLAEQTLDPILKK
ncbi:MAG: nucleoside monophosphate kinase [Candidatus Gracilibacteria bacterium]|jgi:adenylate kinase